MDSSTGGQLDAGGGSDAGELLDGGPADAASDATAHQDSGPVHKRVFLTSTGWAGTDIKTAGGMSDSMLSADRLCQKTAKDLGGTWVAFFSDGTADPLDRIKDVSPWYRIDGPLAFATKAQLNTDPDVPLDITETLQVSDIFVWTGLLTQNQRQNTCSGWTADGSEGAYGLSSSTANGQWKIKSTTLCGYPGRLYCFEQ